MSRAAWLEFGLDPVGLRLGEQQLVEEIGIHVAGGGAQLAQVATGGAESTARARRAG
jgi:hypothetical protein